MIKTLHVLFDHKKLMYERSNFLEKNKWFQNKSLTENYLQLEKDALLIRNKYIKYCVKGDNSLIPNLLTLLMKLKENDYKNTELLIKNLYGVL